GNAAGPIRIFMPKHHPVVSRRDYAVSVNIGSNRLSWLLSPLCGLGCLIHPPDPDDTVIIDHIDRLTYKARFTRYVFFFSIEASYGVLVMGENERCGPLKISGLNIN